MNSSEHDQAILVNDQPTRAMPPLVNDIDDKGAGDFLAAHHVPIISPDMGPSVPTSMRQNPRP